jgi:hypothetical protein
MRGRETGVDIINFENTFSDQNIYLLRALGHLSVAFNWYTMIKNYLA